MIVYMEPLIDELESAWNDMVNTYDRATRTNFTMHVWYMYSQHDHPAYGLFYGWCVYKKWPCPICKQALMFIWLPNGAKRSCFDLHQ
jgi:hypothetical protein